MKVGILVWQEGQGSVNVHFWVNISCEAMLHLTEA